MCRFRLFRVPVALCAVWVLFFASPCFSQSVLSDSVPCRHSLSVTAGGAWSFPASVTGADAAGAIGWRAAMAYDFWFRPQWAVGSGLALSSWRMRTENSGFLVEPNAIDKDGDPFEHHTILRDIDERQAVTSLDIPLRLSFRATPRRRASFFANANVAMSLNFSAKYEVKGGSITTEGFYEQYNLTLFDMPINGFYSIDAHADGSLPVKRLSASAGAETGVSFSARSGVSFSVALFARGSLSDILTGGNLPQYDPDCLKSDGYVNTQYNSVLQSPSCHSLRPIMAGVQFSFSIPLRRAKRGNVSANPVRRAIFDDVNATPVTPYIAEPDYSDSLYIFIRQDSIPPVADDDLQSRINKAGDMSFPLGGTTLPPDVEAVVDQIAALLVENDDYDVFVVGHTCNKGKDPLNFRVGLSRARTVADALRKRGVDSSRISVSSAGASSPVASNDTEEGRKRNRRVEIIVRRHP